LLKKFKTQNSTFKIAATALVLLLAAGAAEADLEWITGGVPKNTADKPGNTVIKDAPGEMGPLAPIGNQDVLVSHLTTCTKIVNQYPVDSVNFFFPGKHNQISYFAYFLIKPSSRIHTASIEWVSPTGKTIAKHEQEFRVSFVDRLLTIRNEAYQWFMVNMTAGMDRLYHEYGQTAFPRELGLYTIHLTVDGQLAGITFFYVKAEDAKSVPTIPAAAAPGAKSNSLPMSTPVSKAPIPRSIK
jgi:hypothetical protein